MPPTADPNVLRLEALRDMKMQRAADKRLLRAARTNFGRVDNQVCVCV